MAVSGRRLTRRGRGVFFRQKSPHKENARSLRSRLEEEFRARLGRLIVRTALPRRHSPDARHLVISSAKELFFDFYFLCCSEASAVERRRLTLGISGRESARCFGWASLRYFVDALTSSALRRDSAKFIRRGTAEGGSSGPVPNVCQKRPADCADEEGAGERAFGNAC